MLEAVVAEEEEAANSDGEIELSEEGATISLHCKDMCVNHVQIFHINEKRKNIYGKHLLPSSPGRTENVLGVAESRAPLPPPSARVAAKSGANQQFGITLSSVPKCDADGYVSKIPAILLLLWKKVVECQGEQSVGIFRLAADADEMKWVKDQFMIHNFCRFPYFPYCRRYFPYSGNYRAHQVLQRQ